MTTEPARPPTFLLGDRTYRRQFLWTSVISAVCHVALFAGLVFSPDLTPARRRPTSVVSVSLVSLPDPGQGAALNPPAPKETRVPEVKKEPKPVPEQKAAAPDLKSKPDTISLAPKKKEAKTSLKKKTYKPDTAIQKAVENVQENVREKAEPRASDLLEKALADLKRKVNEGPPGTGSDRSSGGGGKTDLDQMDIYKIEIAYLIQQNWAFSEQMVGGRKDLEARLVIKILPDGRISDMFFETKSGNAYFDDSVYKAVQKSDPLPPLPRGYRRPSYMVGLRFTPSGLN